MVGLWIQETNTSTMTARFYLRFFEDGKFKIYIKNDVDQYHVRAAGVWNYSIEKNHALGFIPLGYKNWIRLYSNQDSGPQFFLSKDDGRTHLYRANFLSDISLCPFQKDTSGGLDVMFPDEE